MIEHVMSTRSTMAKMKSGKISTDRKNDELRDGVRNQSPLPAKMVSKEFRQGLGPCRVFPSTRINRYQIQERKKWRERENHGD